MGGCLGTEKDSPEQEERNRQARLNAADAAARRQTDFEQTPHGRAAKASIEKAKREKGKESRANDPPLMQWQVG
jgi:hypothetical protein